MNRKWAQAEAKRLKGKSADYLLRELLAIIHGDGGHYTAEHGLAKSTADAMARFYELREKEEA